VTVAAAPLLPKTSAAPVAQTVSLAEEYSDTWEDLETEAVRRAEQAKLEEAQCISFYLDKTAAIVRHRREIRPLWWMLGIMMTICVLLPVILHLVRPDQGHSFPNLGSFSIVIILFSQYHQRRQWLQNQERPTVRVAPQGLFIDTPTYKDVSLSWDEIAEIKPRKRYLEIRASKRRRFRIEERDLPISAEALAARIAIYETGRGIA
jgi:hypothetical protein